MNFNRLATALMQLGVAAFGFGLLGALVLQTGGLLWLSAAGAGLYVLGWVLIALLFFSEPGK